MDSVRKDSRAKKVNEWNAGFVGAMVSNIAFVFRNIFSKKGMTTGKSVGGMNYYACLSMLSLLFLTPFAFAVEGPSQWVAGWEVAKQNVGPQIFWYISCPNIQCPYLFSKYCMGSRESPK